MKSNAPAKLKWHTADRLSERGLPSWMRRWLVLLQSQQRQLALMKSDFSYPLGFAWTSSFCLTGFWKNRLLCNACEFGQASFPYSNCSLYLVHLLAVTPSFKFG